VGAAGESLVNNRWVGSGYGRWVGGTFSDSPNLRMNEMNESAVIVHLKTD